MPKKRFALRPRYLSNRVFLLQINFSSKWIKVRLIFYSLTFECICNALLRVGDNGEADFRNY